MAVGTVTKYNQMLSVLMGTGNRVWDNATAGSCMFILVSSGYTPGATHTTAADLGANVITSGNGAPINVGSPTVTFVSGTTWLNSSNAAFGNPVTITAKYLVCIQPVTPATYATTAKLLWLVDLNTATTGSTVNSVADVFTVNTPTSGWISIT